MRHPGRWVGTAVIAVLAAMFVHMLVTNPHFEWRVMAKNMFIPPVLSGVETTLIMTVLAMVIGVLLGIVFAVMRLSPNPVLSGAAWVYVWFFRAIPRYVLLFFMANLGILYATYTVGVPFGHQLMSLLGLSGDLRIFGLDGNQIFSGFTAGLLGLALSEGAYMAEIVRAGIQSVDAGQTEAASALGMSRGTALRRIVLPQAMRVIIPPTGNETIAMLKDTSLLYAVPVTTELNFQLHAIGSRTFKIIPMAVASILWYLALASLLMVGQYFVERRFSRGFGTRETKAQRAERTARTVGGTH
ncbi:MAG: polar amino acid transport system permease protein [Blastococcus sp.]|nr:polar amino acid transport system permease protein [Blastococcus sp.]